MEKKEGLLVGFWVVFWGLFFQLLLQLGEFEKVEEY